MQSLAPVVAPFGVDVAIVEPAAVASSFTDSVHRAPAGPYAELQQAYLDRTPPRSRRRSRRRMPRKRRRGGDHVAAEVPVADVGGRRAFRRPVAGRSGRVAGDRGDVGVDPLIVPAPGITRVWLDTWEWACCGEPFGVGDEVDLLIATRAPSAAFVAGVGPELAATVDAIESHHQETPSTPEDRVRGRVHAIHGVAQDHVETRHLRRPGFGAPPDAEMPAEGEEWPFSGRDLGNGMLIGSRPSRWMIESVPVPGAVTSCRGIACRGRRRGRRGRRRHSSRTRSPRSSVGRRR